MIIESSETSQIPSFSKTNFYNKPLFETKHFKIIPSLGSLVEGWLMIVPKDFYISFGAISDNSIFDELSKLIEDFGKIMKNEYGNFVMFEHGPAFKKSLIGCGVDHAHLHIVPIQINLLEKSKIFLKAPIFWTSVTGIKDTVDYCLNNNPYLFVTDNKGNSFVGVGEDIPSQLFRRTIAKSIDIEELFDWKEHPFLDNITKTINKLSRYSMKFFQI